MSAPTRKSKRKVPKRVTLDEALGVKNESAFMDVIELPILSVDASLQEALVAMKAAGRSAVVAVERNWYWLFKAGWIVAGIARGEKVLAEVEKRRRVHEASGVEIAQHAIDLIDPGQSWIAIEGFLDSVGRSYLLGRPMAPPGNTVTIITRHEGLAAEVGSGPTDCYCTNPAREDDPHGFDPPLPSGNKCPYDGSDIFCA